MSSTDWQEMAESFLASAPASSPATAFIAQLQDRHPLDVTDALDPAEAEASKGLTTGFLLFAIRAALADHLLSEDELRTLRHLARLLRIEEGDVIAHHQEEATQLLCLELKRLLTDRQIDATEAVHKVRLQELFGLGYDQFIALTNRRYNR